MRLIHQQNATINYNLQEEVGWNLETSNQELTKNGEEEAKWWEEETQDQQ